MDHDFNRLLAEAARELAQQPSVTTTLEHMVELCVASMPACDAAAISVLEAGTIRTLAASDDEPRALDRLQVEAGEGPCHEALRSREVVIVGDLRSDPRWPTWSAAVARTSEQRSVMSFCLFASEESAGALILYSRSEHGFEQDDLNEAQVLAAHASVALATNLKERQLHQALETRTVIGQATGILIERFGLTPDQAFAVMRRVSQHHNIKLHVLAGHLVETGVLLDPGGHVDGLPGSAPRAGVPAGSDGAGPGDTPDGLVDGSRVDGVSRVGEPDDTVERA